MELVEAPTTYHRRGRFHSIIYGEILRISFFLTEKGGREYNTCMFVAQMKKSLLGNVQQQSWSQQMKGGILCQRLLNE